MTSKNVLKSQYWFSWIRLDTHGSGLAFFFNAGLWNLSHKSADVVLKLTDVSYVICVSTSWHSTSSTAAAGRATRTAPQSPAVSPDWPRSYSAGSSPQRQDNVISTIKTAWNNDVRDSQTFLTWSTTNKYSHGFSHWRGAFCSPADRLLYF